MNNKELTEHQRTVLYKDCKIVFGSHNLKVTCFGCGLLNAKYALTHSKSTHTAYSILVLEFAKDNRFTTSICKECLQEFRLHPKEFVFKVRLGLL